MQSFLLCDSNGYFEQPEVSNSMMKTFRSQGSWTYYHKYIAKSLTPDKPSDAMRLGSAFHGYMELASLALAKGSDELDLEKRIITLPSTIDGEPLNLRKKSHREEVQGYKDRADKENKPWVTDDEMESVSRMVASATENPLARSIMKSGGKPETKCINEVVGVGCKAMADLLSEDGETIIDYKTTRAHTPKEFMREALYKYKYQYQAAHYCDVFERPNFIFIAVRNFAPYETMVYRMSPDIIAAARQENHDTLRAIKACEELNEWHSVGWSFPTTIEEKKNEH